MVGGKVTIDSIVKERFPRDWTIFITPTDLDGIMEDLRKHQKKLDKYYGGSAEIIKGSISPMGDICSGNVYFKINTPSGERHLMFTDVLAGENIRHAALELSNNPALKKYIFPVVSAKRSGWFLGGIATFVQEMFPSVSLHGYMKAETSLEDDVKIGISIGQALAALHSEGYTHASRGIFSSFAIRKSGDNYLSYFANLTETAPNSRQDPNEMANDLQRLFCPRTKLSPNENFKYSGMVSDILQVYLNSIGEKKGEIIRILKPVFEYDKGSPAKNSPVNLEVSRILGNYEKKLES